MVTISMTRNTISMLSRSSWRSFSLLKTVDTDVPSATLISVRRWFGIGGCRRISWTRCTERYALIDLEASHTGHSWTIIDLACWITEKRPAGVGICMRGSVICWRFKSLLGDRRIEKIVLYVLLATSDFNMRHHRWFFDRRHLWVTGCQRSLEERLAVPPFVNKDKV